MIYRYAEEQGYIWEICELFQIRTYLPLSLPFCFFPIAILLEEERALWITNYMAR